MRYAVLLIIALSWLEFTNAQCDPTTPSFLVDLSSDPNASYFSPDTVRNGKCCGATGAVRCIEFVVTLHPDAEGILFEIFSGAIPGGALFYQIGCGPPGNVGTPICLSGAGPHRITFCKPGSNQNVYKVTSVAEPTAPDSIFVNDGCTGLLGSAGYDPTTIQWNSIFPGAKGAFNNYLSCTTGCDTTFVNAQLGYPPFIDVEICGSPFGGCDTVPTCDTARVKFFSTLAVEILPKKPAVCFGSLGTTITATPQGGSPPYTYSWSNGSTSQSVFVDTGTYIVELGDTSGCPPTYDTIVVTSFNNTIEALPGSDFNACRSVSSLPLNGAIQAAGGGRWIGNGTFNPSADSLITSYLPTPAELSSGTALIKLLTTGNRSCPADSDSIAISFKDFDGIINTASIPVSCKGEANGVAIANVTGSATPYSILWDAATGNQVGDSAKMLIASSYSASITDSLGCVLDTIVNVIEADTALFVNLNPNPVTCFGDSNGSISIQVSGGIQPYFISWDPLLMAGNVNTLSGLKEGTYSISIMDSTNCIIDTFFTILGPAAPLTLTLNPTNVSCNQGNDGTIQAIPSGGFVPYSYAWDNNANNQTTATAVRLGIGSYVVVITDSLGCTATDSAMLTQPPSPITFTSSTTNPSCNGGSDGTATVLPSGGTPPYTYLWDTTANSQTNQTATGLSAGTYAVTIFDQNTCLYASPIVVTDPPALFVLNTVVADIACFGDSTGTATVTPIGGTPPYTYLWDANAGSQTDSIANNLGPGSYSVAVFDQNSCIVLPAVIISQPTDSLTTAMSEVSVTCLGTSDGMAIVNPIGGTSPYTYLWEASAGSQTTDTAINLSPNTYAVTVTDSLGCMREDSVLVTSPAFTLTTITDSVAVSCFNGSDGTAIITPIGGNAPYTFLWDTNAMNQTTDSAKNLPAGSYSVTITDSTNCAIDTQVVITEPPNPLNIIPDGLAVACFGGQNGKTWIDISGGTAPYQIVWDSVTGNQTTDTAFNLFAGVYEVSVTDANGCLADTDIVIIEPSAALSLNVTGMQVSCFDSTDGYAFVDVTGGFVPYSYQWPASAGSQTNDTAFNLSPSTYMVTVSDSLGCVDNIAVTIDEPGLLLVNAIGTDLNCHNDSSGSAEAFPTGGTPPYDYLWANSGAPQITKVANGLKAEQQIVTIIDSFNCQTKDTIMLAEPNPINVVISSLDTICPGANTKVTATASGGSGTYVYDWIPAQAGNDSSYTVNPIVTTSYVVNVIDNNGCSSNPAVTTIYINDYSNDSISVNYSGDICAGDTVRIDGFHNGRFGNYTYQWRQNDTVISQNIGPLFLTPRATSAYKLTITNECLDTFFDSLRVIVYQPAPIKLPRFFGEGCVPLTLNFENQATFDTLNPIFIWELGDGTTILDKNTTHTYENAGNYTVKLTLITRDGCESTSDPSTGNVIAYPKPIIEIDADPIVTDIRYPTIDFSSLDHDPTTLWLFGDGNRDTLANTSNTYEDTGRYKVQFYQTTSLGCLDSTAIFVEVRPYYFIEIPNAFTPNRNSSNGGKYADGDLSNDVFHPHTKGVADYHLRIFNRWGELIFESFDLDIGWDGYYKGELSQQEVYIWKLNIIYENGQKYNGTGDVTLFR